MSTLFDLIREGFSNIRKNKSTAIGTVIILTIAFALFAGSIIFQINIKNTLNVLEEQIEITLILEDDLLESQIFAIKTSLEGVENIKSIEFVSKEDGFIELKKSFSQGESSKQNPFDNLDYNPLPDKFSVKVKDVSDINYTIDYLENRQNLFSISKIINQKEVIDKIIGISKGLTAFFMGTSLVLGSISVVIISNNTKLNIEKKMEEIFTMTYLGATKMYISFPFIVQWTVLSLISSFVGILIIYIGYYLLITSQSSLNQFFDFVSIGSIDRVILEVLILGLFVGISSSYLSLKLIMRKIFHYEKKTKLIE